MNLAKLKKFVLETIFPQFCLNCRQQGGLLCYDCFSLIETAQYSFCPFCQFPQRVFQTGKCPKHRNYNLDGLFSAVSYQNSLLKKLIVHFKYPPYCQTLAKPLSYLIIAYLLSTENKKIRQAGENSFFAPIPLAKAKNKKRGFNQAELIAKELSSFFKIPLLDGNLRKIKKTRPQAGLSRQERLVNLENCFILKNPSAAASKTIFLVDDVFTTGATMEQCAKIFKQAGAKEVWGVTIAREPLNF